MDGISEQGGEHDGELLAGAGHRHSEPDEGRCHIDRAQLARDRPQYGGNSQHFASNAVVASVFRRIPLHLQLAG